MLTHEEWDYETRMEASRKRIGLRFKETVRWYRNVALIVCATILAAFVCGWGLAFITR